MATGKKLSDLAVLDSLSSDDMYFIAEEDSTSYRVNANSFYDYILSSAKGDNTLGNYPYYDAVELDYTWDELFEKVDDGDLSDIRVGDYKTETIGDYTYTLCVAQICSSGNDLIFISDECWPIAVQWNTTETNNGTSDDKNPFAASNVYNYLLNTVYPCFPSDLQSILSQIQTSGKYNASKMVEARYSSSGLISTSSGYCYDVFPMSIFLPSEIEVMGYPALIASINRVSALQWAIFSSGWLKRLKTDVSTGEYVSWWLFDAADDSSSDALYINADGYLDYTTVTDYLYVPICFALGEV